jgi:hypothetical protein
MDPKGSLPCSQQPATGRYPVHTLNRYFLSIRFNTYVFWVVSSLQAFVYAFIISPNRATWHGYLILPDLILLIISGEGYKLLSFSVCVLLSLHPSTPKYQLSYHLVLKQPQPVFFP